MHTNRTKLIFSLSLVTCVVVFGAVIFFFVIIKNKNEHTQAVLTTLESKIKKKNDAKNINEAITETEQTRTTLNGYFVDPAVIDGFVSYIENIGTSSGTTVNIESVDSASNAKNSIAIKVSAEGGFSDVINILKILENSPYKIQVSQTYISQRLKPVIEEVKNVKTTKNVSIWHIDISFTALTSS